MSFAVRVVADSVSGSGTRLTTVEVTFPRIVLAEWNTHRMLSRCSASSRAIPIAKRITAVENDPFIPETFGKNRPGMQAVDTLQGDQALAAEVAWRRAIDDAVRHARTLADLGVHKQLANRLLEPFSWHTVIASATEWDNFFALRCHPDAQPEIRKIAVMVKEAMGASQPTQLDPDQWHLPYVQPGDRMVYTQEQLVRISCGRCARVSYLTHDGKVDPEADIALAMRLVESGHMSPMEHAARPMTPSELYIYDTARIDYMRGNTVTSAGAFCGNFRGWVQARKLIRNEHDFSRMHVSS